MAQASVIPLHLEIGPLREREYTGISQVTAAIAEQMLGDSNCAAEFFFGRMLVEQQVVKDLLYRRNGEMLIWHLQRARLRPAPSALSSSDAALFPNRKTCRRGFAREYQIVHDLSTLLTPQFHHQDTIEYHALTMEADILTNDVTFCVSEATRSDVLRYFPEVPPDRVVSMPLAASGIAAPAPGARQAEPYMLVLGTIEPRKNITQVLAYISANPDILSRFRVVFLGRFGWGESVETLLGQVGLQAQYEAGSILFPGFVNEAAKISLICNAAIVVYPSLFEGFGLPVLEALSAGVPCVTTRSSSIPEVGGECAYYFDPFSEGDFERALLTAVFDLEVRRSEVQSRSLTWAAQFSWERTYQRMMAAIRRDRDGRLGSPAG